MTHDYGHRGARRIDPKLIASAIVAVGLIAVFAMLIGRWNQAKAVALAQAWTVTGPPCPSLAPAAAAALPDPPQTAFDDYDIHFARASGAVSCMLIKSDGGRGMDDVAVCKFNSPQALEIKTGSADAAFGPGLYHGVFVTVAHGQPRCVVVPRDQLRDKMAEFSTPG